MKDNAALFDELLKGTEDLQDFEHELLPSGMVMKCKPLTGGELRQLKIIEKGNMRGTLNVEKGMSREEIEEAEDQLQNISADINFADQVKNDYATKYKAISLSTGATDRVIDTLRDEVIGKLFGFIMDISNIKESDLDTLKQFRKNK